jgi:hypothetical protein
MKEFQASGTREAFSPYIEHPASVSDPYSFFTDPDPDPEDLDGGQYGSGSNTDPGL